MFENYPKIRPTLPPEFQEVYAEHFKSNREGATTAASLAQKMESWLHIQIAKDVEDSAESSKSTLELGAGTLNHLKYEAKSNAYDIVEPFASLYKGRSICRA
jgi:hypothetical protein